MSSSWDFRLLDLQLQAVSVEGASLQEAWVRMLRNLQVRSVLYLPEELNSQQHFEYKAAQCTVRELYDAFVTTYPQLTWRQDPDSGIVWFFPKALHYSEILSNEVHVATDEFGLRCFTDILTPLQERSEAKIYLWRRGFTFLGVFDFPVDIPAGTYSVRQLLNQCCVCNPDKTFVILVDSRVGVIVTLQNLEPDNPQNPTRAALSFWQVEIDPKQATSPDSETIRKALSNPDPRIRWAGRCYVELVTSIGRDALVREAVGKEEALWTAVALTSLLQRMEGTTHRASVERIEKEFDPAFFEKGDPGLCTLVALEMARHGRDCRGLDFLARRQIGDADLVGVRSELFTFLRRYKGAREAAAARGFKWFGLGREQMLTLDQRPVFGP